MAVVTLVATAKATMAKEFGVITKEITTTRATLRNN